MYLSPIRFFCIFDTRFVRNIFQNFKGLYSILLKVHILPVFIIIISKKHFPCKRCGVKNTLTRGIVMGEMFYYGYHFACSLCTASITPLTSYCENNTENIKFNYFNLTIKMENLIGEKNPHNLRIQTFIQLIIKYILR